MIVTKVTHLQQTSTATISTANNYYNANNALFLLYLNGMFI